MAVRKPTRTVTRTYLYLDEGRFPATIRYVNRRTGVDLKHAAPTLAEAASWVLAVSAPAASRKKPSRSRS